MTAELPQITEVERLRLEPGDALVVHLNATELNAADADSIRERARGGLGLPPDFPVLILAAGHRLSVVNADGAAVV